MLLFELLAVPIPLDTACTAVLDIQQRRFLVVTKLRWRAPKTDMRSKNIQLSSVFELRYSLRGRRSITVRKCWVWGVVQAWLHLCSSMHICCLDAVDSSAPMPVIRFCKNNYGFLQSAYRNAFTNSSCGTLCTAPSSSTVRPKAESCSQGRMDMTARLLPLD